MEYPIEYSPITRPEARVEGESLLREFKDRVLTAETKDMRSLALFEALNLSARLYTRR